MQYALKTVIGKQRKMEDMYVVESVESVLPDSMYFAIFDGHGGSDTAIYCQTYLHKIITNKIKKGTKNKEAIKQAIKQAIKDALYECNRKMKALGLLGGNTVILCLVTPRNYYFASLGDSLILLVRNKEIIYKSPVYKIQDRDERVRIENNGGVIINDRINNYLAVSRAMGDFDAVGVITDPSIDSLPHKKGDTIIMLSDGVTDRYTNTEIVKIVSANNPSEACDIILKNSIDNASIIIIN